MILELYQHIVKTSGVKIKIPDLSSKEHRRLRMIVERAYNIGVECGKRELNDKNDDCNSGTA